MNHRVGRLAAPLLACALVVGCGGGDGGDDAKASDGFAGDVNRICAERNEDLVAVGKRLSRAEQSARQGDLSRQEVVGQLADAIGDGRAATEEALNRLRELQPSDDGKAGLERVLTRMDRSVAALEALQEAYEGGDIGAIGTYGPQAERAADQARAAAKRAGFVECARNLDEGER